MAKKKNRKPKGGGRSQTAPQARLAVAAPAPAPAAAMPADDLDAEVARASALLAGGQAAQAREILELVLEAEPSHRLALETLGRLHMTSQDFDSAVKVHNRLVVFHAPDPRVHNAMGVSLLMAGRIDEALIHLTRCMDLEPGNVRFVGNLAKAFMMKGDYALAQELLEKAFLLSQGAQMSPLLELLDYCQQQAQTQRQARAQ